MQMMKEELLATLRLQCIPNIGDISSRKLIAHCGTPTAVFKEKKESLLKIGGIGTKIIKELYDNKYLTAAENEYSFIQKQRNTMFVF